MSNLHEVFSPEQVAAAWAYVKRGQDLEAFNRKIKGAQRFWTADLALAAGGAALALAAFGLVLNDLGKPVIIPPGGYRNSIIAPPTPRSEIDIGALVSPTSTPEAIISAGDYINLAQRSFEKKDANGKNLFDYFKERGYKILSGGRDLLPLETIEFGQVPEGRKIKALRNPIPSYDPRFEENIAGQYDDESPELPIYAVYPQYDVNSGKINLFALTGYLETPQNPGWVVMGSINSGGADFYLELRKEFRTNLLEALRPAPTTNTPSLNPSGA